MASYATVFTVIRLITFGVGLRTFDTYGDINFALQAFTTKNYLISCLILSPVLICLGFTFKVWKDSSFDNSKEKRWSWILVLLNLWPQYQVAKLLGLIIRGISDFDLKEKEDKLERQLLYIEPWIEAIPQFFCSISVYFMLSNRDTSAIYEGFYYAIMAMEQTALNGYSEELNTTCRSGKLIKISFANLSLVSTVFGDTTLGIANDIMYPISVLISLLGGVKCITLYLHTGPLKLQSKNMCKNIILFIAKLAYIITSIINKLLICTIVEAIIHDLVGSHGIYSFFGISIVLIVFPFLMVIAPLIRYLSIKTFIATSLKRPQLIILPIVTDYVIGPVNGYGRCHSGCCCCCLCCCWTCCCNECRFDEGLEISIHKKLSWIKFMYNFILLLPIYIGFLVFDFGCGYSVNLPWMEYFFRSLLVVLPLGLVAFTLSLHLEDMTVMAIRIASEKNNDIPIQRRRYDSN